jgi:hypothetical protein
MAATGICTGSQGITERKDVWPDVWEPAMPVVVSSCLVSESMLEFGGSWGGLEEGW